MIFVYIYFGCGVFSALMTIGQWILDGCLIGDGPEDRFYYLSGMLSNAAMTIITGPVCLLTQLTHGMPILPRKHT